MDTEAPSTVWLLWTLLLETSGCRYPGVSLHLNLWGKSPTVQLLGRRAGLFLTLWGTSTKFSTMRYHLTPVRMGKINKAGNHKCWRGCGERGTFLHCWECELVQPLWKTLWRFLKELKIDLPYDPAIPLLGIYPKDTDAVRRQDTCTPMFIAAMSTIVKLEGASVSIERWMDKEDVVYVYNGILLSH